MIQVNEEYLSFRGEIKRTRALTHGPISSLPLSAGFENEILAGQTEEKKWISLQPLLPSWICPCVYTGCHEVIGR